MDLFEESTHSFIIKIWREWTGKKSKPATWRGHITHVPDGEQRVVSGFDDISDFILPYIEAIGVRSSCWTRGSRWLRKHNPFHGKRLQNTRRNERTEQGGRQ